MSANGWADRRGRYFIYLVILLAGIFSSLEPFYRAHTGTWWFYTIE